MSSLAAAVTTLFALLGMWAEGLSALARLGRMGFAAWRGPGLRAGLVPQLLAPGGQRLVFAVLRAFQPTLALRRVLVKAYPNTGTAVVTRREDVIEVLRRDEDFEVVYEPRMREITAGENFFLGMQPGWPYTRDVSAMRLAARRSDVADIVAPRAATLASEIVAGSGGTLNLPGDLALRVSADMVGTYFGTPGPSEREMIDWATAMFWFLFGDLGADPQVGARARQAAADCRAWLDAAIAARKAAPTPANDVLNRCLALQAAETPGMDDLGIRNNLIGLLIGAVPTISKAATLALDELLRRPEALRVAQAAARAGDDALMEAHVWEALRFNPHNPVIYRRAVRDATIAAASLRARRIPKGTLVFAANHSAMFDGLDIPDPRAFRADRPWDTYIHWGYGMHACFGDAINRAVIPAILKPLLARPGLRATGPRDDGGTPFPVSLPVAFD
jgi:cytochrome P450